MFTRHRRSLIVVGLFLAVYGLSFPMKCSDELMSGVNDWRWSGADAFRIALESLIVIEIKEPAWWAYSAAWFANPLMWSAVFTTFMRLPRITILLAVAAIIHAIPILFVLDHLPNGPAYYLWIGSPIILIVGALRSLPCLASASSKSSSSEHSACS